MRRGYLLIFFSPSRASNACERCGEFPRAPTSKPSHRDWNSPSLSSRSSRGRPGRNTGKRLKISAKFLGCNRTMNPDSAVAIDGKREARSLREDNRPNRKFKVQSLMFNRLLKKNEECFDKLLCGCQVNSPRMLLTLL